MSSIRIEEKQVLEYIRDTIMSISIGKEILPNDLYHHNTSYENVISIIQSGGIYSISEMNTRGIISKTKEELKILNDSTSHINGTDGISLAKVGLDDLYPNEDEFLPYNPNCIDIIIDKIFACRKTSRYGNEFIAQNSIKIDDFKSIDIRLLKYIEMIDIDCKNYTKERLIEMYNNVRTIAKVIQDAKLNIPLREMSSEDGRCLNIKKLSNAPSVVLKK